MKILVITCFALFCALAMSARSGLAQSGTLDITNTYLVYDFPDSGPNPESNIRSYVISGRGVTGFGATWKGTGITSSTAAADVLVNPESTSVAYAHNAALPLGSYAMFGGKAVDPSSILIRYTRTGDANLDGRVNDDDVTILSATYAPRVPQPFWALGDFDYNGFVDDDDATLLGAFYNPAAPPITTVQAALDAASASLVFGSANANMPAPRGVSSVPEPATWLLLIPAVCGLAWLVSRQPNAKS